MNHKKLSKQEIIEEITKIFSKKNPSQKEIKKAKKLAMSKNIKLRNLRKKFCKKCSNFFTQNNSQIRIRKPFKTVKCKSCGYISRWMVK